MMPAVRKEDEKRNIDAPLFLLAAAHSRTRAETRRASRPLIRDTELRGA